MRTCLFALALCAAAVPGVAVAQPVLPPAPVTSTAAADAEPVARIPVTGAPAEPDTPRVWASAEYLLWWAKGQTLPPIFGTLPLALTGQPILDVSQIGVIYGGGSLDFHAFSGGRFNIGGWLDGDDMLGVEGSFFFLGRQSRHFDANSGPDPIIGPLFTGEDSGLLTILYPGEPELATESASATASERLWGAQANVRYRALYIGPSCIDLLAGFRYLDLSDNLDLSTTFNHPDFSRTRFDHFDTRNEFSGGQIGASFDVHEGHWFGLLQTLVALGDTHQSVNIHGQTVTTFGDGTVETAPGGILTQPTNIGHYSRSQFAVVPEVTFNVGYAFSRYLRAYVGYNFLYISQVTRAGDAIDPVVNASQLQGVVVNNPTPATRPVFQFGDHDYWVQGINFGLEVDY